MMRKLPSSRIRGYTMVELLIVVTIMVMLVALALPIAKKVLEEGKTREASRQLNAYFAMAKARAVQTGRPVGLEFVCSAPLGDTSGIRHVTQLYLAEVQPPYSGDVIGATAKVNMDLTTNPFGPWPLNLDPTNQNASASAAFLIEAGERFEIQFGHKGPWFVAFRHPSSGFFFVAGPTGPDGNWGRANFDDDGNNTVDDPIEYLWPGSDDLGTLVNDPVLGLVPRLPAYPPIYDSVYQIRRAPRRIGSPLEMPIGTCIDMEYSGMGAAGAEFGVLQQALNQRLERILLLFSPQGSVEGLYGELRHSVTGARTVYGPVPPTGTIHFLVGKVEKVSLPTASDASQPHPSNRNLLDPAFSNLADPNSLWVSVSRSGGGVTSTENMPPPVQARGMTPSNVVIFPNDPQGRTLTLNPQNNFAQAHNAFLFHSREAATGRVQMTGR